MTLNSTPSFYFFSVRHNDVLELQSVGGKILCVALILSREYFRNEPRDLLLLDEIPFISSSLQQECLKAEAYLTESIHTRIHPYTIKILKDRIEVARDITSAFVGRLNAVMEQLDNKKVETPADTVVIPKDMLKKVIRVLDGAITDYDMSEKLKDLIPEEYPIRYFFMNVVGEGSLFTKYTIVKGKVSEETESTVTALVESAEADKLGTYHIFPKEDMYNTEGEALESLHSYYKSVINDACKVADKVAREIIILNASSDTGTGWEVVE